MLSKYNFRLSTRSNLVYISTYHDPYLISQFKKGSKLNPSPTGVRASDSLILSNVKKYNVKYFSWST